MWSGRILTAFVLALLSGPALAGSFGDNYWGGINTQNVSNKDVIGSNSVFNISYVDVSRTNGGNTLKIVIHTGYAGKPGTSAALGTTYGSLFFTSVSNYSPIASNSNSTTTAPKYANDVYQPNDWTWAFVTSGAPTGLYQIGAVTDDVDYKNTDIEKYYKTLDGKIIMSNMYGNPVSAPHSGNSGYYFREGQAVQFVPDAGERPLYGGSMSVVNGSTITYYINDQHTLGDTFAMSWAMTCANDVFQRVVSVPGPVVGAGLPGLLFVVAGCYAWCVRRRTVEKVSISSAY